MKMNLVLNLLRGIAIPAAVLLGASIVGAQHPEAPTSRSTSSAAAYDVNRETTLVGTVESYASARTTPPLGPRVSLKTTVGLIDIHLGDARLLSSLQFVIEPGDVLRVIGENVTFAGGTQFIARIVQKGSWAIEVRTARGFPIASPPSLRDSSRKKSGSVL